MVLSNDEVTDAVGALRLGFVALLAPAWLLGGIALVLFGERLLGVGAIGIGLVMLAGGYRLYRAMRRPDVVQDERARRFHDRAGYNGFWTMLLVPALTVGFSPFVPQAVVNRVATAGGWEAVWAASLGLGLLVYLCSLASYRSQGL